MPDSPLSLNEAINSGRLSEFIEQQEAKGIGPVERSELMEAIKTTIKQPRSEDQTSRSVSRDGSAEK